MKEVKYEKTQNPWGCTHTYTHTHTYILLEDKKEKGSIAIYVIVSFIFLTIVLIAMLAASKNSLITAIKAQETIKNIYENDVAKADEIYSREIAKQSELPEETEQTWTQDRTWVEDNKGMRLEVGSTVTGYSITANGSTYGNGKWYILGAKDGKLLITTNENVKTSEGDAVTLSGQNGYINGIAILNKEVAKYTNYNYTSQIARTIDVDDINRVTGYNPDTANANEGTLYEWGNEITYTKNSSDGYIYYKGTKNPTSSTKSSQTVFTYWTGTGWKTLDSGESSSKIKSTYYMYYPQTLSEKSSLETSINGSSNAYSLLFSNTSSESNMYWLGTQYITTQDYVSFGMKRVENGRVGGHGLKRSYGPQYTTTFGLRPVVSLDNSVIVSSDGTLATSSNNAAAYTEQQQNWVQDKTIVRDTTYNFVFEVGGAITGYTANGKSDWYVLGAKDGKLLLTTNSNVTTVTLSGQSGFTGGITTLNTTAASYTNSSYADGKARTIDVDDINNATGYDPDTAQYVNSTYLIQQWRNEVTYTKNSSDGYIYYIGTKNPTSSTKSSSTTFTYWTGTAWRTLGSGESSPKIKHTWYPYYPQTLSETESTETSMNGSSNAYSLLFANTSSDSYLMGSYNIGLAKGYVGFGFRYVKDGRVTGSSVYRSDRNYE